MPEPLTRNENGAPVGRGGADRRDRIDQIVDSAVRGNEARQHKMDRIGRKRDRKKG